jgi:hypothetical protein
MFRALFIVLAVILPNSIARGATAACAPPPGFVDTPHPAVAPADQLVSHVEEIVIDRPLAVALSAAAKPLKDVLHSTNALPGVSGDYDLSSGEFGPPGSRRLVCLTDGSTLEEQALERQRTERSYRFRYVVWNYTSEKARPIVYGVGNFVYSETSEGSTHIVWTYSFQLNRHRFPGYLGSLGDFLFRIGFLDRQYADLMRGTLTGYKTAAESQPSVDHNRAAAKKMEVGKND